MNNWEGFAFPMGFFVGFKDGKVAIGKRDPVTKQVIDWLLVSDEEDFKMSLNGFMKGK